MQSAPIRLFNAVFWPLSVWGSLGHFDDHAADDYVERTSPIVATAVAFWIALIALVIVTNPAVTHISGLIDGQELVGRMRRNWGSFVGVLWFFVPVIYLIGFWLFTTRDERFPR